jgi:dTDP-4-amino-4,6-dideoxygalactose transaminase
MDLIMNIAHQHRLYVIEDAAQAIDSYFYSDSEPGSTDKDPSRNNKHPLGSMGHLAAFSFHETKNINAGEGGLLAINDDRFSKRAEIIWEKGTNRAEFFRGEVNKYGWVDTGSSFLPSELTAAYLWAQLENLDIIQLKRKRIWNQYYDGFQKLFSDYGVQIPHIPTYAEQNGHLFYIVCNTIDERSALIKHLKSAEIDAVFHYLSLHSSSYYQSKHDGRDLVECDRYADRLLRLPLYYEMSDRDVSDVIQSVYTFYTSAK